MKKKEKKRGRKERKAEKRRKKRKNGSKGRKKRKEGKEGDSGRKEGEETTTRRQSGTAMRHVSTTKRGTEDEKKKWKGWDNTQRKSIKIFFTRVHKYIIYITKRPWAGLRPLHLHGTSKEKAQYFGNIKKKA